MTTKKKKSELAWLDALHARRVKVFYAATNGNFQTRSDPLDTWPMKRLQPMMNQAFVSQDLQMDCQAELVVIPVRNLQGSVDTMVVAEVPGLKPSFYVSLVDAALGIITTTHNSEGNSLNRAS